GYITGFPNDTVESIRRDIEIIKKELPVDLLEFFFLTPLPGSEDHQKLTRENVQLDPDLNRYDLNHVCAPHPKMSRADWERAYQVAWDTYYTDEHMDTVLRRLAAKRANVANAVTLLTWFKGSINVEKIHPLEGGVFRFKFRRDRRPGLPIVPRWKFYPRYVAETLVKISKWVAIYWKLHRTYDRIRNDPRRFEYNDLALTPVTDDDVENLEMFHTRSAEAFVAREQRRHHPAPVAVA
ncbi:MAG: radical SAM protein, partial [Verrucomicrobiota bacterium]|nr:radical SAM protein [Verrucomicrobiota bacterium]